MNKTKLEVFEEVFNKRYEYMNELGKDKYVYGFGYLEQLLETMIDECKKVLDK